MELFFVTDINKKDQHMHEFITSLLEKYRQLMIKESKNWNDTYELTDHEKDAHRDA